MTYYGKEISVNYIYGACTLPSERGQGLMRQLIQKAFEVMESRKVALTVIIPADPWLFDYYRDLGYTEAFDYSEETYIRPSEIALEQGVLVVPPEVPSMESLYNFFNKKQRERICYVLHGRYYPARITDVRRTNADRLEHSRRTDRNDLFLSCRRLYLCQRIDV